MALAKMIGLLERASSPLIGDMYDDSKGELEIAFDYKKKSPSGYQTIRFILIFILSFPIMGVIRNYSVLP